MKILKKCGIKPGHSLDPNQHGRLDLLSETDSVLLKTAKGGIKFIKEILIIIRHYVLNSTPLTCPPESLETGETAKDITGSGTFMEVMVYLTDPSVNVSPDDTKELVS